jgi:GH24 family phage-related lysozyme (muramidase)
MSKKKNKKQNNKLIIDTDKLYKHMKSVEGYKDKIYDCSSGVPTIGVGFALLISDKKGWKIKEKLFSNSKDGVFKKAGLKLPKKQEIKDIQEILKNVAGKSDKENKEINNI